MIWAIPTDLLSVTLVGRERAQRNTKSSSIQATRLAPDTQIKSQSWLSFSGRFARAIRRQRLAIRGDNSILRKSSMPGPYQDAKDRFLTGCIEIRGSSSGVEHHVANVVVVGSNPISRSLWRWPFRGWWLTLERVGCVMASQAIQPDDSRGSPEDEHRRA